MGELSREVFEGVREQPAFIEICHDLDLAEEDQRDLFDILDVDASDSLSLDELVEGIGLLRGEARRSDIASVNFLLQKVRRDLQMYFEKIQPQDSSNMSSVTSLTYRQLQG